LREVEAVPGKWPRCLSLSLFPTTLPFFLGTIIGKNKKSKR
jgi:hypothetical protein